MKNEKSAKNSKELKLKIGLWGYKKGKALSIFGAGGCSSMTTKL